MTLSMNNQVQVSVEDLMDTLNSVQAEEATKTRTGIAPRPDKAKSTDSDVLGFFRDMFANSQAKAVEAREAIQPEMYRLAKESSYEVSQARQLANITSSLTAGSGEIGRKPLPEGTTLRPVAKPPMTTMRDVTGTDEGKLDNEKPLRDLASAVANEQIPSEELEPVAKDEADEADEVINTLVEQLTNTRITAGKAVEEPAPMTAEAEAVSAPKKGGLMSPAVAVDTPTGRDATQQLLDRIALGEGADPEKLKAQAKHGIGTTPYDMVYNYGNTLAPSKPVTQMTLSELEAYQSKLISATKGNIKGTKQGTSAVGKYQVIKTSLFGKGGTASNPKKNSWAAKLGLTANTVYTPEVQEAIGMLALKESGYDSYINGDRSQASFQNRLANMWASVARDDGSDVYGQGLHTFKKDLQPMFSALAPQRNKELTPKVSVRPKTRPEKTEE